MVYAAFLKQKITKNNLHIIAKCQSIYIQECEENLQTSKKKNYTDQ